MITVILGEAVACNRSDGEYEIVRTKTPKWAICMILADNLPTVLTNMMLTLS